MCACPSTYIPIYRILHTYLYTEYFYIHTTHTHAYTLSLPHAHTLSLPHTHTRTHTQNDLNTTGAEVLPAQQVLQAKEEAAKKWMLLLLDRLKVGTSLGFSCKIIRILGFIQILLLWTLLHHFQLD